MVLRLLSLVEANDEQRTTARSNVALYCVGFPFLQSVRASRGSTLMVPSIFACLVLAQRCAYASSRERDDRGCFGAAWGDHKVLHVGELCGRGQL